MPYRCIFDRRGAVLAAASVLTLSACATSPEGDTPINLALVAPAGPIAAKPVQSWRALKFTNVVRQRADFSCGAAAVATIFNYAYGKGTSEEQVLVNMLKISDPAVVREKGFSLLDMKNYVQAVGMQGDGYEVPYDMLQQLKVPGIVLLNMNGYKHFVVIRKVDGDYVHVGDPALGNRLMTRPDFERMWNNIVFVILGEGYDENTVLRRPPPPLSAKRLVNERAPVQNAEVYDFGLGPAFHFVL
jgi:predicted double-glycine peptidase